MLSLIFHGCKASVLTGQNAREVAFCKICSKPRYIYSAKVLTNREMRELRSITRHYDYVCGVLITPSVSFLAGSIFTRLEMHCNSLIEWAYYASKLAGSKDICCYCSAKGAQTDAELKRQFKSILHCVIPVKQ